MSVDKLYSLPVAWFSEVIVGAVEESKFTEVKSMSREIGNAVVSFTQALEGSQGEASSLDSIFAALEAVEVIPQLRTDIFRAEEIVALLASAARAECTHVGSLETLVSALVTSGRGLKLGCIPHGSMIRVLHGTWEANASPSIILDASVSYILERLSDSLHKESLDAQSLESLVEMLRSKSELGGCDCIEAFDLMSMMDSAIEKGARCKGRIAALASREGVKMLDAKMLQMASDGILEHDVFLEVAGAICTADRDCHDGTYEVLQTLLEKNIDMNARERIRLCVAIEFSRLSGDVLEKAALNQYVPARCIAQGAAGSLKNFEAKVSLHNRSMEQTMRDMQGVILRQGDEIKQLRVLVAGIARDSLTQARDGQQHHCTGVDVDSPRSCGDDEGHLVDVSIELNALIEEGNFEGAFSRALHSNTPALLVWTCYNTKPESIFRESPPKMTQSTTLALIQHLSCKLGPDMADSDLKLAWLSEALLALGREFDNAPWSALLGQVKDMLEAHVADLGPDISLMENGGSMLQLRRCITIMNDLLDKL